VFKVIDLGPEGKPEESDDDDRVAPPPPGTTRWVDLLRADAASLDLLRRRFNFHPLALEECATFEVRSNLDEYAGQLFSAIFLPLGFIVGFWGQNFDAMPFHSVHVMNWWRRWL